MNFCDFVVFVAVTAQNAQSTEARAFQSRESGLCGAKDESRASVQQVIKISCPYSRPADLVSVGGKKQIL